MPSGKITFDKSGGTAKGRYDDLSQSLEIMLEPATDQALSALVGSDTPSHHVYAGRKGGALSIVGAAWAKEVGNGKPNAGQIFYSMQLDDPIFPTTLNLTAFQSKDVTGKTLPGEFDVVWRRARANVAA